MYKRFDLYLEFKKKHIENTCRYLFFFIGKKIIYPLPSTYQIIIRVYLAHFRFIDILLKQRELDFHRQFQF